MSTVTAETTIDRTFDQTAEHIHANGRTCPTCNTAMTPSGFHMNGIDCELEKRETVTLTAEHHAALRGSLTRMTARALIAEARVAAFERLADRLAKGIDRINAGFDAKLADVHIHEAA